jgi:hypothetical protein
MNMMTIDVTDIDTAKKDDECISSQNDMTKMSLLVTSVIS